MKLSIIILCWNSEQHIGNCLRSIYESFCMEVKSCEIFVVDNGSTDQSRSIIEKFGIDYPGILKPIYLEHNSGTTYSRNLALRQAKGDYIAIVDSDVVAPKGIIDQLIKNLDESMQVGMVVPKLVYGNGEFQKSTDDFPTVLSKIRRYFFLKNIEQAEAEIITYEKKFVDYAISAFWLLKKEVVETVGLLDEKIFYAPEDVDYCLRIWKAGYKILYVPSCKVVHDAQEISRGLRFNKAFWEHIKGLCYFFFKHKYCCKKPLCY